MKKNILVVLVVFLVVSCDSSQNYLIDEQVKRYHVNEHANYQITDTLEVGIDEITDPLLYGNFQFQIIDSIYYLIFTKSNNQIEFVSIENTDNRINVPFFIEGPNAVAGTEAIYVHNLDSIFFLSSNELKRISLHNRKGEILSKWDLNKSQEEEWMGETTFFEFKFNSKLNEIYYWTYSGKINKRVTRKTFKIKAFNIIDETIREVGRIPDHYKKVNYHPFYQIGSYVSAKNSHIINFFPPINRVYKSDLSIDSSQYDILEFTTDNFQDYTLPFMDEEQVDAEIEEELSYMMESNFNYRIISNEKEDLYYLFYRKELPFLKPDGSKRTMYEYDFDVVVFNKNLQPLGLIEFENPYNYYSHVSFALEDKLYVSLNNPLNPDFNEDVVQFAIHEKR